VTFEISLRKDVNTNLFYYDISYEIDDLRLMWKSENSFPEQDFWQLIKFDFCVTDILQCFCLNWLKRENWWKLTTQSDCRIKGFLINFQNNGASRHHWVKWGFSHFVKCLNLNLLFHCNTELNTGWISINIRIIINTLPGIKSLSLYSRQQYWSVSLKLKWILTKIKYSK